MSSRTRWTNWSVGPDGIAVMFFAVNIDFKHVQVPTYDRYRLKINKLGNLYLALPH